MREQGEKLIFNTTDSEFAGNNGQTVEIIDVVISTDDKPVFVVQPDIGGPFIAFTDELKDK